MPTAVLPLAEQGELRRKRFTRNDVDKMREAGLFDGQRFELIDGDLIDKMGQNPPHIYVIRILQAWLAGIFGVVRLQVQSPIEAAEADRECSLPEPDLSVLAEAKAEYRRRFIRGDETVLVVEVSDTSLRRDTVEKRDLYARAGVPEYWVVNIADRELVVHRDLNNGRYSQVTTLSENANVAVACRPDVSVQVAQLLP